MRFNTHGRTPSPQDSKTVRYLINFVVILLWFVIIMAAFACVFYANDLLAGIMVITIALILTIFFVTLRLDISRAYVEINEETICVVDYYLGRKKEKHFWVSDITAARIVPYCSSYLKGYRMRITGIPYIIFEKEGKYLFKMIYFPETVDTLTHYINNLEIIDGLL